MYPHKIGFIPFDKMTQTHICLYNFDIGIYGLLNLKYEHKNIAVYIANVLILSLDVLWCCCIMLQEHCFPHTRPNYSKSGWGEREGGRVGGDGGAGRRG